MSPGFVSLIRRQRIQSLLLGSIYLRIEYRQPCRSIANTEFMGTRVYRRYLLLFNCTEYYTYSKVVHNMNSNTYYVLSRRDVKLWAEGDRLQYNFFFNFSNIWNDKLPLQGNLSKRKMPFNAIVALKPSCLTIC